MCISRWKHTFSAQLTGAHSYDNSSHSSVPYRFLSHNKSSICLTQTPSLPSYTCQLLNHFRVALCWTCSRVFTVFLSKMLRTGHSIPDVVSPMLSRGKGSAPLICWQYFHWCSLDAVGLLSYKGTLLDHVPLAGHQDSQVPFYQAAFQLAKPPACCGAWGLCQVQDFAFPFL